MRQRLLSLLMMSCAVLPGCVDAPAAERGGSGAGKADDGASDPDAATRAKILAAIHADYVDPTVRDQAAEITVDDIRVAGDFAWVTGVVRAGDGGEIDWTSTELGDEVADGLFDGPNLQALVRVDEGAWSVSDASIGSTDVWWDGVWFRFPVSCALFPGMSCTSVTSPTPGTTARRALVNAIHAQGLDAAVHGQPNELVFSLIRAGGDYAFAMATVRKPGGGELDWTDSEYADEVRDGLFDGPMLTAILQKTATGWQVHELDIGATDVSWDGAWTRYESVPCALFPVTACPSED